MRTLKNLRIYCDIYILNLTKKTIKCKYIAKETMHLYEHHKTSIK